MSDLPAGGNYRLTAQGDVLVAEVWRRPDLSSAEGARLAEEIHNHLVEQAPLSRWRGMVLDLRNAPPVAGPRTQASLQSMVGAWDKQGKPSAIVSGQSATQRLQHERIIRDGAPEHGAVASSIEEAFEHAGG